MQQTATTSTTGNVQNAPAIAAVSPDEAVGLDTNELERFVTLLESLTADQWSMPTYCAGWDVRQVTAHVAGALAAYVDWETLLERSEPWIRGKAEASDTYYAHFAADLTGITPERWQAYLDGGFTPLDALNQYQVDERATVTPADLIDELRVAGPIAFRNRRQLPDAIRSLPITTATGAKVPVHYFFDVIYPRDMWMHRMEIALATEKPLVRMAEHEGRLTALVMRDLSRRLPLLDEESVVYRLTGPDGGAFRYGTGETRTATLTIDAVDFHLLASGRRPADETRQTSRVTIDGDRDLGARTLARTVVTY